MFEISTSTWPRTGHVNLLLIPIPRRTGSLGREAEEELRELFRLFWEPNEEVDDAPFFIEAF